MTEHTVLHWLDDIALYAKTAREALGNIERQDYAENWDHFKVRMVVQRAITIISEASRRLPDDLKAEAPHLPWRKIAGVGNMLRHEYHRIDDKNIYDIVTRHLPELEKQVLAWITQIEAKEQS